LCFFFSALKKFFERYKRLNDYKPSQAEAIANVDRFKKFGAKATIFAMMDRWGKTIEEVTNMQATLIYDILLHDFEKSMYQKDLQAAQQQQQKMMRK
jgi:predicted O-methyltransferase YrrM